MGLIQQWAYLGSLSWLLYAASSARRAWEESIYLYNPRHLGLIDEVRADWLFPPFTGERCGWVSLMRTRTRTRTRTPLT